MKNDPKCRDQKCIYAKNILWIVRLLAKKDCKVNMKTKSNMKSQNENFKM